MKNILFFISIFILLLNGCKQNNYSIKGSLQNLNDTKAYLIHIDYIQDSVQIIDSSDVNEGEFKFSGSIEDPIACQIKIGRRTTINFLLENSDINIQGSIRIPEEIRVKGSKSNDDFNKLIEKDNIIKQQKNDLWASMINTSYSKKSTKKRMEEQIKIIEDSLIYSTMKFIQKNSKSYGALYYIYYLYVDKQINIKRLEPLINQFNSKVYKSEYYQYLKEELDLANNNIGEGSAAPLFHTKSLKGENISNDNFSNKYYFIDFTSTWCPFRNKRNKKLKQVYNSYKSDSFSMLTFYIDKNNKILNKLSLLNKLPIWHQASDYKYWESPITKKFNINSIPNGILIDNNGKILLINPTISELSDTLKVIFNKE